MTSTNVFGATVSMIIRGGQVVNADWAARADVVIGDGKIIAVVEPGTVTGGPDVIEIDARDRIITPGGVDPHCHVGFTSGEFTSLDNHEECTRAAVFGGTTTIVDFAIPRPGQQPLAAAEAQMDRIGEAWCDVALHGCVVEWDDTVPEQLRRMRDSGIATIKMFTTYRGETMANEDTILHTMKAVGDLDGMVIIHCEANHLIEHAQSEALSDGGVAADRMALTRPPLAETAAVAEVLAIAETLGTPVYFVHQSTAEAVRLVADATLRGVHAYSEAVVHHLVLDESEYQGAHPERFVCCPPLRSRDDVDALARRVLDGSIHTVGSDHCCYDLPQKTKSCSDVRQMPNGLPGVETRLPVFFSAFVVERGLSVQRFVEMSATMPARLNGLYPRKGAIMPGSDADLVLWDPTARWTARCDDLHMATDYTPYEGLDITGRPATVIVHGSVVVHEGKLLGVSPAGTFVAAGPLGVGPTSPRRPGSSTTSASLLERTS